MYSCETKPSAGIQGQGDIEEGWGRHMTDGEGQRELCSGSAPVLGSPLGKSMDLYDLGLLLDKMKLAIPAQYPEVPEKTFS